MKRFFDYILRNEFIYSLLIALPTLPHNSIMYKVREKSQALRLRRKGIGGWLQDTFVRYPQNVMIGSRVTFGGRVLINGSAKVAIGDDCLIAYGAIITTATHDQSIDIINRKTIFRPILIHNNVWIGVGAKILPGVELQSGIIVGAGAVVTKSFEEPDMILLGVPAKPVRKRFS